jgi:alcohol dehydrogenase (cytochrome c)
VTKTKKILLIGGSLAVLGAVTGGALYLIYPVQVSIIGGLVRNHFVASTPAGTIVTELNPAYKPAEAATSPAAAEAAAPLPAADAAVAPTAAAAPLVTAAVATDWPSYNRTVNSDRYSPLSEINKTNAGKLKILCSYDVDEYSAFETGLIMVEGALIGTTVYDTFSIDPNSCKENWRVHESYKRSLLPANRGATYWGGMVFRGTHDGRVLAYDFKTGKRIWQQTLGDAKLNEVVSSAPIAWDGVVYVGNAGGDFKGAKGHMYALDAKSGKILWQFFLVPRTQGDIIRGPLGKSPLDGTSWKNAPGIPISGGGTWTSYTLDTTNGLLYVPGGNPAPDFVAGVREGDNNYSDSVVVLDPKTGNYKNHFQVVENDYHDWDVSNTPILIHTRGGKQLMVDTPKDGYLYGFNLADNRKLYQVPVTRVEQANVALLHGEKAVHFCPGAVGGSEWNSPSYVPDTNLVLVASVEWCESVRPKNLDELRRVDIGQPWAGVWTWNPLMAFGRLDKAWAGWIHAVDADTGVWKWRLRSNYPIVAGMTPTAGGVVFFGDVGGNFYALDSATGQKLWGQNLHSGALGGGIITYAAGGAQKIAVAAGFSNIMWPTKPVHAKIVVLGLDGAATPR